MTEDRSQSISGFTFGGAPLEKGGQIDWQLGWRWGKAGQLTGKAIGVEWELQNANIYFLTASYHMPDAQDPWLLKDVEPIGVSRFGC